MAILWRDGVVTPPSPTSGHRSDQPPFFSREIIAHDPFGHPLVIGWVGPADDRIWGIIEVINSSGKRFFRVFCYDPALLEPGKLPEVALVEEELMPWPAPWPIPKLGKIKFKPLVLPSKPKPKPAPKKPKKAPTGPKVVPIGSPSGSSGTAGSKTGIVIGHETGSVGPSSEGGRPDLTLRPDVDPVASDPMMPESTTDDPPPAPDPGPVGPGTIVDPGPVVDPGGGDQIEVDFDEGTGETTQLPADGSTTYSSERRGAQNRDEAKDETDESGDGSSDDDDSSSDENTDDDETESDEETSGFAFDDGGPILGGGGAEGFDPNLLTNLLLGGSRRPGARGYGPSFGDLAPGVRGGESGYDDVPTVSAGVAREGFADRVGINRLTGGDPDAGGGSSVDAAMAIATAALAAQKDQEGVFAGTEAVVAGLSAIRPGFDVGETGGDPDRIDEFDHRGMLAPAAAATGTHMSRRGGIGRGAAPPIAVDADAIPGAFDHLDLNNGR